MLPTVSDLELAWAIFRHTFINRHGVGHCSPRIPLVIESTNTTIYGMSYEDDLVSLSMIRQDHMLTHDIHECRLGFIEWPEILGENMSRQDAQLVALWSISAMGHLEGIFGIPITAQAYLSRHENCTGRRELAFSGLDDSDDVSYRLNFGRQ